MNDCIPVEEMGTLSGLPDDDARRRHVASCPRCSSLMFLHDQFVRAEPVVSANPDAADEQLARFITAQVEGASPAKPLPAARMVTRPRRINFPVYRAAVVAAAVVLAVVALWRWQPWGTETIVYRGETREQFTNLRATEAADGLLVLSWDAVSGADAYRVIIIASDLTEVTRLPPTSETTVRYERGAGLGVAGSVPSYWQVTALVEGGELLTSDPQRLP